MTGAKLRGKASRPGRRFAVAQLPAFIDNSRPTPESAGRKLFIHAATIATLLASSVYLGWRIVDTVNLAVWWVSVPLVAAEVHNTFGLLLFTLALWDIDVSPPWRPVDRTGLRVAVLVTTYNEPEEVLTPTIAATVALEPAHETWVLDDGHRPAIQRLAREMGARYLSRPDNAHAKAGNLNHALGIIEADVIAVLDADHVAGPNFLRHTLCYFDDPRVAIVQTPQDFYNLDSFEHERRGDRQFNEEAVFYRVIGPGKNKWDAAFWCGTSALVRTKALAAGGPSVSGSASRRPSSPGSTPGERCSSWRCRWRCCSRAPRPSTRRAISTARSSFRPSRRSSSRYGCWHAATTRRSSRWCSRCCACRPFCRRR